MVVCEDPIRSKNGVGIDSDVLAGEPQILQTEIRSELLPVYFVAWLIRHWSLPSASPAFYPGACGACNCIETLLATVSVSFSTMPVRAACFFPSIYFLSPCSLTLLSLLPPTPPLPLPVQPRRRRDEGDALLQRPLLGPPCVYLLNCI